MNVTARTRPGCSCCDWERGTSKNRRRQARTIKRRERAAWKAEVKHYHH